MIADFPLLSVTEPYAFRSLGSVTSSGTAVTKPAGAAVGDLVFVVAADVATGATLSTSGGSAWSRNELTIPGAGSCVLFWKVLVALDVSNAWAVSASARSLQALCYNAQGTIGVGAAVKSTANPGASEVLTLAGFTVNGESRGVAAFMCDRDGVILGNTVVDPPGFTRRVWMPDASNIVGVYGADMLSGYLETAVVIDPSSPTGNEGGWLVELL